MLSSSTILDLSSRTLLYTAACSLQPAACKAPSQDVRHMQCIGSFLTAYLTLVCYHLHIRGVGVKTHIFSVRRRLNRGLGSVITRITGERPVIAVIRLCKMYLSDWDIISYYSTSKYIFHETEIEDALSQRQSS